METLEAPSLSPQVKTVNRLFLMAIILLVVGTSLSQLRYLLLSPFDADEVEHAHVAWMLSKDIMPYTEIHQNHTPTLWILIAPLLGKMPETAQSLLALRAVGLLSVLGCCVAGIVILRQLPATGALHLWFFLLLFIGFLGYSEFHRFRPDPVMACCVAWAIVFIQGLQRSPLKNSILSGVLLGLGASFSPKMAPLCLLLPLIVLGHAWRKASWQPLVLIVPHTVGFFVGLIPMFLWLWWHDLLKPFYTSTIVNNSHALNLQILWSLRDQIPVPLVLLTAAGIYLLIKRYPQEGPAQTAVLTLIIAAILGFLVRVFELNHYSYNLQAFAVPGAVCGAMFLAAVSQAATSRPSAQGSLAYSSLLLGILCIFYLYVPVVMQGHQLVNAGITIPQSDMVELIQRTRPEDATCVGFAPHHPVFCRDACDLYLAWDWLFLHQKWMTEAGKENYRQFWRESVEKIVHSTPDVIVLPVMFEEASKFKVIERSEYHRLEKLLAESYQLLETKNGVPYFVRQDLVEKRNTWATD